MIVLLCCEIIHFRSCLTWFCFMNIIQITVNSIPVEFHIISRSLSITFQWNSTCHPDHCQSHSSGIPHKIIIIVLNWFCWLYNSFILKLYYRNSSEPQTSTIPHLPVDAFNSTQTAAFSLPEGTADGMYAIYCCNFKNRTI